MYESKQKSCLPCKKWRKIYQAYPAPFKMSHNIRKGSFAFSFTSSAKSAAHICPVYSMPSLFGNVFFCIRCLCKNAMKVLINLIWTFGVDICIKVSFYMTGSNHKFFVTGLFVDMIVWFRFGIHKGCHIRHYHLYNKTFEELTNTIG